MAVYVCTFFSRDRLKRLDKEAALAVTWKRAYHWKHNRFIKRAYRAAQNAINAVTYVDAGAPLPVKPRRVNGRLRSTASRMNERQRRERRRKILRRKLWREGEYDVAKSIVEARGVELGLRHLTTTTNPHKRTA